VRITLLSLMRKALAPFASKLARYANGVVIADG
jgi:hypothetical protein